MKTFVTVNAVDGFDAGTEWSYKELQKQFGPNRIAKMKASGELVDKDAYAGVKVAEVVPALTAKASKKGKPKRGEWDLTDLQRAAAIVLARGDELVASEVASAMGLPGQAIKVSGILSSLVERGVLVSRIAAGRKSAYVLSDRWRGVLDASGKEA